MLAADAWNDLAELMEEGYEEVLERMDGTLVLAEENLSWRNKVRKCVGSGISEESDRGEIQLS